MGVCVCVDSSQSETANRFPVAHFPARAAKPKNVSAQWPWTDFLLVAREHSLPVRLFNGIAKPSEGLRRIYCKGDGARRGPLGLEPSRKWSRSLFQLACFKAGGRSLVLHIILTKMKLFHFQQCSRALLKSYLSNKSLFLQLFIPLDKILTKILESSRYPIPLLHLCVWKNCLNSRVSSSRGASH